MVYISMHVKIVCYYRECHCMLGNKSIKRHVLCIYTFKGAVSPCKKLFLNSAHLLDINFCANNNCSKVLKKFKIHVRRHFPHTAMGWRPLAHICLWVHVSSCLHSTRRRYIVSINMASIKA